MSGDCATIVLFVVGVAVGIVLAVLFVAYVSPDTFDSESTQDGTMVVI